MMFAPDGANDVAFGNDVRFAYDAASLMLCPAGHRGKHLIIDRKAIYIISAIADTSLAAKGGDIIDFCIQSCYS